MERDYFLDAEQAVEMGLVDKVLTSREEQENAMGTTAGKIEDKENDSNGAEPASSAAPPSQD
jgi:Clp protease